MFAAVFPKVVTGKYFWELVFNYDNRNNTGTIRQLVKTQKSRTINTKETLIKSLNIKNKFEYENKSSISLAFEGESVGTESKYTAHLDVAYDISRTVETNEAIEEIESVEREYEIGGGSTLSLYQLCYTMDGAFVKADIFSNTPLQEVTVGLKFKCVQRILGLDDILDVCLRTVPGSSNKAEWQRIRDTIISVSDKSEEEAFRRFVEILAVTEPARDNRGEWEAIRKTCGEIISDWESVDKQKLLKKLLLRFTTINPARHNILEWGNIRGISESILKGLKEVF